MGSCFFVTLIGGYKWTSKLRVIPPFDQGVRAAARFCDKAARLAFEHFDWRQIHVGRFPRKLHRLAATRASDIIAVLSHSIYSPTRKATA
jgi:hypothetical protein